MIMRVTFGIGSSLGFLTIFLEHLSVATCSSSHILPLFNTLFRTFCPFQASTLRYQFCLFLEHLSVATCSSSRFLPLSNTLFLPLPSFNTSYHFCICSCFDVMTSKWSVNGMECVFLSAVARAKYEFSLASQTYFNVTLL